MSEINPTAEAAYRRSLERAGEKIEIRRISGVAPNSTFVAAEVTAIVRNYSDDAGAVSRESGYSMGAIGAITQGSRQVIVMEKDLVERRFPLPLQKNDEIRLFSNDEKLTVQTVDAEKRHIAGAIELMAAGVA